MNRHPRKRGHPIRLVLSALVILAVGSAPAFAGVATGMAVTAVLAVPTTIACATYAASPTTLSEVVCIGHLIAIAVSWIVPL